mgnify:CR=1 FL=1
MLDFGGLQDLARSVLGTFDMTKIYDSYKANWSLGVGKSSLACLGREYDALLGYMSEDLRSVVTDGYCARVYVIGDDLVIESQLSCGVVAGSVLTISRHDALKYKGHGIA